MSEHNPYGLLNLWQQGDAITRTVAVLLLLMSVVSWTIIVLKARQLWRIHRQARVARHDFWHSRGLGAGLQLLLPDNQGNPFRALAEDGINAAAHHSQNKEDLHGKLELSDWIQSCLRNSTDNIQHQLQIGLPILASIGSTAPFVGLFGTVWGIYHALVSIGVSGQAGIDKVAGPVGEALIMTAFGLAVAIPAVLGYNTLLRHNKGILTQVGNFAHDLHACLLTGTRIQNGGAA